MTPTGTPAALTADPTTGLPRQPERPRTNTHRRIALAVGVLYLIGTAAGVASAVVTAGRLDGPDDLAAVATDPNPIRWGALLVIVMALALAMIPALIFPILSRHNRTLGISYVIFRGALETALYLTAAISWLLLTNLAQLATPAEPGPTGLATLLIEAGRPTTAIRDIVFSIGALMLYTVLHKATLVPRWLSGWGIVGALAYLAAGVAAAFTLELGILWVPLALQEMVMAAWLITRGFNTTPKLQHSRTGGRASAHSIWEKGHARRASGLQAAWPASRPRGSEDGGLTHEVEAQNSVRSQLRQGEFMPGIRVPAAPEANAPSAAPLVP